MHLPLTIKEHLIISLTGGTFETIHLKPKSQVQPQIVHLEASRVSGSLQTYPEGDHNNQTYDLSKKGKSLQ